MAQNTSNSPQNDEIHAQKQNCSALIAERFSANFCPISAATMASLGTNLPIIFPILARILGNTPIQSLQGCRSRICVILLKNDSHRTPTTARLTDRKLAGGPCLHVPAGLSVLSVSFFLRKVGIQVGVRASRAPSARSARDWELAPLAN